MHKEQIKAKKFVAEAVCPTAGCTTSSGPQMRCSIWHATTSRLLASRKSTAPIGYRCAGHQRRSPPYWSSTTSGHRELHLCCRKHRC
ncbi:unnamed protein product [Acanthoscelides obtectus]|uniref:Uncharacterized protein n=1 Tax=Acanthoscelides obtectus TaxID=200917 RepID=A0A9P0LPB2_ACAOB|nr:unnamed protein product [Acanthoscelides obtectus]CAK1646289.1 hypothetical protein AOBTE_LOCUS14558 [Acanthoscelides obtectus]